MISHTEILSVCQYFLPTQDICILARGRLDHLSFISPSSRTLGRIHQKISVVKKMVFGGPIECRNSSSPQTLSFITSAMSSLLMLTTVPGNLLICVAVVKDPFKTLRSPFNLFLLNISAADLVVGLAVLPLSIAYHSLEGMGLMYDALTKALHLSFFISCTASVLGIAALSIDRYVCITSPMKYRLKLKSLQVKRASLIIWLISVICPFTYLYVDFIIYTLVFANGTLLFTLLVLAFVNHKIHHSLQTQRKQLQTLVDGEKLRTSLSQRDARVTKTFLFFLGSFLVLTLPPLTFSYVLNFCSSCNCRTIHIFRDFQFLSILFPSSVNPFIYALRLPNFRRAITVICRKILGNRFATKSPQFPILDSSSTEALSRHSPRRPSVLPELRSVDETLVIETNARIDVTTRLSRWRANAKVSFDVNQFDINTLHVDSKFHCEERTANRREHGISQFYRVTTTI